MAWKCKIKEQTLILTFIGIGQIFKMVSVVPGLKKKPINLRGLFEYAACMNVCMYAQRTYFPFKVT